MKKILHSIKDEKGMITVVALIVLIILTIIGISAINNTNIELQITRNDRLNKVAFFAAEAAKGYVAGHPALYGSQNLDDPIAFPNRNNPNERFTIPNSNLQFNGTVQYVSSVATSIVPRASGYEYGQYRAHRYQMIANGIEAGGTEYYIDHGFYRIGL